MEQSGALTLEMTGPGVWTDVMLTPLKSKDGKTLGDGVTSVILPTLEGYSLIRYGSMGSWKTEEHKADYSMWRNMILFYATPLLVALLVRWYRRYVKGKRSKIA